MSSAMDAVKITRWNSGEYMLLAKTLIERLPKRNYANATRIEDLDFSPSEFDTIQHHALSKDRWRVMQSHSYTNLRRHLLEAFAELRGSNVPVVSAPARASAKLPTRANPAAQAESIRWNDEEWKLFAHNLHTTNGELHFLNSTDLTGLTLHTLNNATLVLPKGRRRTFHALEVPRNKLLEIYRTARAERDELFYPKLELPKPTKYPLTPRQERMMQVKRAPAPVVVETEQTFTVKEFTDNAHKPAAVQAPANPAAPLAPPPALVAIAEAMADHQAAKNDGQPKSRENMIFWTREEWLLIAIELLQLRPGCYQADAGEMVGINSPLVARAQLVLPLERQRNKVANMTFKQAFGPKLLSAFRDLTNRQLTAATEAARVEAEPVPPAAKPAPIVHAPPVTIPGTSAAPKEAGHNIRWTKDEWLAIAIKLHHQYPLLNLLDSEHLACLTSGDVAFAQRVLDPSRQRPNLKIVSFKTILKSHLLAAFKELKARLADPAFEPAAVLTAVPVAAPAAQPAPVSPVEPVAVAPAAPFTPPAVVAPADMNPYEAALRPLLDLMMHQLAAGPLLDLMVSKLATTLQPMLARTIETAGAAVLAAAPPVAPAPSPFGAIFKTDKPRAASTIDKDPPPLNTSPSGPSLKNYAERAPAASSARQGKPSIGLVGGGENGNDYKELTKTFPGIEFHYVSREKYMKSVKNCDKVIGMNKFSSHNLIDKAKRTVGDRFVPTDGGLSEMKRMISIWIASGILPGMPATRLDEAA